LNINHATNYSILGSNSVRYDSDIKQNLFMMMPNFINQTDNGNDPYFYAKNFIEFYSPKSSFNELTKTISDFLEYNPIYLEMAEPDALRFSSKVSESVIWLGVEKGTELSLKKHPQFKIEVRPNTDISERFDIGLNLQGYKRFIDLDISFPLRHTSALLSELKLLLNKNKLESAFFGHAGDGNWHIHVFYEHPNSIEAEVIHDFDLILSKYEGNISGEHGIGEVHKNRFVKRKDKSLQDLYKSIKSHLDPNFQLPSLY
jgi:hypothetical protein